MKKEIGGFAVPKAGHDRGKLYVIVGYEEGKFLLADGRLKTMETPRKKQRKHLDFLKAEDDLKKLFSEGERSVRNEEIKRAIKLHAARVHIKQEVTDVQE
ncbi:MAG: hypothetical protein HFI67_09975 [Lachnospiraceae bacterium]|jgi:ribosomal protein L14E/L6E/L27E|nr:hypothetical protein [Lachnospiraceae bacterium]